MTQESMGHIAQLMLVIMILREAYSDPVGNTKECIGQCKSTLNNSHILLPAAELCRCYGINVGSVSILNVTRIIPVKYSLINNERHFSIKIEDLCAFFGEQKETPINKRASDYERIPRFPESVQSQALTGGSQADPYTNTDVELSPAPPRPRSSPASATQREVDDVTRKKRHDTHRPDTPTEDFVMQPASTTTPPVTSRTAWIPVNR